MSPVYVADDWDGSIRLGLDESSEGLSVEDVGHDLDAFRSLLDPTAASNFLVAAESDRLIESAESAGLRVKTLPRASAIWWGLGKASRPERALVLSLDSAQATLWKVVKGDCLGDPIVSRELSLRSLAEGMLQAHPVAAERWAAFRRRADRPAKEIDEEYFEIFKDSLKTGEPRGLGPIRLQRLHLDFAAKDLARLLSQGDPKGEFPSVVLADWAGCHCNLGEILGALSPSREIVSPPTGKGFEIVLRGLMAWNQRTERLKNAARIEISPAQINVEPLGQGASGHQVLALNNVGATAAEVSIESDKPWIQPSTHRVKCPTFGSIEIAVTITPENARESSEGELRFTWKGVDETHSEVVPIFVEFEREPILVCVNKACSAFVGTQGSAVCSDCEQELRPASVDIWARKTIGPLLETPEEIVRREEELLRLAGEAELDLNQAGHEIDSRLESAAGSDASITKEWLQSVLMATSRDGQALLEDARTHGIDVEFARRCLDRIPPADGSKSHKKSVHGTPDTQQSQWAEQQRHLEERMEGLPKLPSAQSGRKGKKSTILGPILVVIVALAILLALSMRPDAPTAPSRNGAIIVRVSPAARAQLDNFYDPDGGRIRSRKHRFSNLESRTYIVKVWRQGYEASERRVSVTPGRAEEVSFELSKK